MIEFKLPDVGEGLTEAEVVAWHVAVGDTVEVNDVLVDIETAKSVVELPSPAAGTILALHVPVGTTVEVGTVLVSIGAEATAEDAADAAAQDPVEQPVEQPVEEPVEERPLVLVGTGPSEAGERRRRLVPPAARTRAAPPVRQLAKRLGVDLTGLSVAPGERVTRADVERAAAAAVPETRASSATRETRTPVRGVRRMVAEAMVASAFTAPHVTEWLTVDVTRTMDLVARLRADRAWAGVRITPLVVVARALLLAVRQHPEINARWDDAAEEIVQHHYVNLGIAAATPRGLIVPNIKDAHELDLRGLAEAMAELVETARSGRTSPQQMSGGTITITNIGAFGVDAGTPILNPGEAAILAFGAVRDQPWVHEGQVVPRKVTQLALSFDHRLVDGALGSAVLSAVGRLLHDPAEAFLQ